MKIKSEHSFQFIKTNGIKLHALCAGKSENKLVILLHGFPEYMKGWENQVDDLVDAGYYVMVPDQRGYNLSDKPWFVGSYRIDTLVDDIVGLIDHTGKEKAHIAGHDWGGAVAWYMGMKYPNRIEKLLIVNVPHGKVMREFIKKDKKQRKRSWYVFMFQIPILPQLFIWLSKYKILIDSMQRSSIRGTYTDEDISEYLKTWKRFRSITSILNWYRAMFRRRLKSDNPYVSVPLLLLWGERDRFLKFDMAKDSMKYCDNGNLKVIEGATHWVLKEKPEIVNPKIIEFFST